MKLLNRLSLLLSVLLVFPLSTLYAQNYLNVIKNLDRSVEYPSSLSVLKVGKDSFDLVNNQDLSRARLSILDLPEVKKAVVSNGLKEIQYVNDSVSRLVFNREQVIRYNGKQRLIFDEHFFQNASILEKRIDQTDKPLLIFVIDPHSEYEEIPFIKKAVLSVIQGNSSSKFYFLNEGYFKGNSREVGIDSLKLVLSSRLPAEYQGYRLSQNFIIDVAMECRLLNEGIREFSIDDPESIRSTLQYESQLAQVSDDSLNAFDRKVSAFNNLSNFENLYSSEDRQWLYNLAELKHFGTAKIRLTRSDRMILVLNEHILRLYLKRDTAMAGNILAFTRQFTQDIPFIFIGSAHLHGIVDLLPNDINYLLVSAEGRYYDAGDEQFVEFDSMRMLNSRQRALERFAKGNLRKMKVPVSPTGAEWGYVRDGIEGFSNDWKAIVEGFEETIDKKIKEELLNAINTHPEWKGYKLEIISESDASWADRPPQIFCEIGDRRITYYYDGNFENNIERITYLRSFEQSEVSATEGVSSPFTAKTNQVFQYSYFQGNGQLYYMFKELGSEGPNIELFQPDHRTSKKIITTKEIVCYNLKKNNL